MKDKLQIKCIILRYIDQEQIVTRIGRACPIDSRYNEEKYRYNRIQYRDTKLRSLQLGNGSGSTILKGISNGNKLNGLGLINYYG